MAEQQKSTKITDLNRDSVVHCTSFLNLRDISSLAVTCKYLNTVAYSDSIWHSLFRERWPEQAPPSLSQLSCVRDAYVAKNSAVQKFKFVDPLVADFYTDAEQFDQMCINQNSIIFSQGPLIKIMKINSFIKSSDPLVTLRDHTARITCMRFYSLTETSLFRNETQRNEKVLVTSSLDHSIRLWWKGCCQRCFRGHNGPVTTLSNKLLGEGTGKVFASGGVDGTVRLWSLSSSGKRGRHALQATLYGHGKPLVLMSVAGHKSFLLVSMSKDSKVRVWDVTTSSSVRSSSCVGMTSLHGPPVGLKCHESLIYVAAGSTVAAIDLRTMGKAFSTPCYQQSLFSFELLPSKSLICTGGIGSAMIWDMRKSSETLKAKPIVQLDGHTGPVKHLYTDHYKIVSGSPEDPYVNVWESDTGRQINSLRCGSPTEDLLSTAGCSAMAVNGCQIVTGSFNREQGFLCFRDFNNASCQVLSDENELVSKFWDLQSCSGSDDESDG